MSTASTIDWDKIIIGLTEARSHLIEDETELTEFGMMMAEALSEDDDEDDVSDASSWNLLASYLDRISERLQTKGMTEDVAADRVLSVAASLMDDGRLPEFPEDDDEDGATAWLGAAQSIGFEQMVYDTL